MHIHYCCVLSDEKDETKVEDKKATDDLVATVTKRAKEFLGHYIDFLTARRWGGDYKQQQKKSTGGRRFKEFKHFPGLTRDEWTSLMAADAERSEDMQARRRGWEDGMRENIRDILVPLAPLLLDKSMQRLLACLGPDFLPLMTRNPRLRDMITLGKMDPRGTERGHSDSLPLLPATVNNMVAYRALFDCLPTVIEAWLLEHVFLPKLLPPILAHRQMPSNWVASTSRPMAAAAAGAGVKREKMEPIPQHLLHVPVHAGGMSAVQWMQQPPEVQTALDDPKACITYAWAHIASQINQGLSQHVPSVRSDARDCMRQLYLGLECTAPTPDMQAMRWPTVGSAALGGSGKKQRGTKIIFFDMLDNVPHMQLLNTLQRIPMVHLADYRDKIPQRAGYKYLSLYTCLYACLIPGVSNDDGVGLAETVSQPIFQLFASKYAQPAVKQLIADEVKAPQALLQSTAPYVLAPPAPRAPQVNTAAAVVESKKEESKKEEKKKKKKPPKQQQRSPDVLEMSALMEAALGEVVDKNKYAFLPSSTLQKVSCRSDAQSMEMDIPSASSQATSLVLDQMMRGSVQDDFVLLPDP